MELFWGFLRKKGHVMANATFPSRKDDNNHMTPLDGVYNSRVPGKKPRFHTVSVLLNGLDLIFTK